MNMIDPPVMVAKSLLWHDPEYWVASPHLPIERGMREVWEVLRKTGHEVVDSNLSDGDDKTWEIMVKLFCHAGDQDLQDIVTRWQEPFMKRC